MEIVTSGLPSNIECFTEDIAPRQLMQLKIITKLSKLQSSTHYFGFIIASQALRSQRQCVAFESARSFEISKESFGHLISRDRDLDLTFCLFLRIEVASPERNIENRRSANASMRKKHDTIILIDCFSIQKELGMCTY